MTIIFFKHKWEKITFIVLAVIVSLILLLAIVVNRYWSPILAAKVKEVVNKSSDGLYHVNFSSAELEVIRGRIVIYNISLTPDTAVFNLKKKQHLAPNNLLELHIKRLTLSHIHPLRLYFKHKLDIGEIVLNSPELNLSYQLNHTRDTVVKDNRTIWQKISKSLHSIHVGSIMLGDVKFRYEDYSGNKVAISELKEMNVSAYDLLIDSATQTDKTRLLYCRDIIAELNNYSFKAANGLYTGKVNHVKLSTLKSQLNIEGLTLKPINSNGFFAKSHKDRFSIHLDSLQLKNFDFLSYHKYRTLNASSLSLTSGGIEIFSNPHGISPPTDRVTTFPNASLDKLNADMKIDTLVLKRINVTYTEFNDKANNTGSISFTNTNGRFRNVTTNKEALKKNHSTEIQLTTYFMNRGKLNLKMNLNLVDDDKSFDYKATLGEMDLRALNVATMPLAMVKINSGTLKQLSFDIKADKHKATGKLAMLYNDAKVTLLKADTALNNLKQRPIASMYANIFILKHDNPDAAGGLPRTFFVNYQRAPNIPFFKFIWQTLLSGIKPSVGLDKKTQQATAEMVSKQAVNKQNRKAKKELRIQKRDERRKKRAARKLAKELKAN